MKHRVKSGVTSALSQNKEQPMAVSSFSNEQESRDKSHLHCIHTLFEEQVERSPDVSAVLLGDQQLTYQGLNEKANQLAHYLQSLGVKRGALIGLCIERSVEMIVCIFAILKAGGAYVPLDPASPRERLFHIMQSMQAPFVLTQQRFAERFPADLVRIVLLDQTWPVTTQQKTQNLSLPLLSQDLCYIIFTSGSTGVPKGCMIHHSAWLSVALGIQQTMYQEHQRVPLRASINGPLFFDASAQQIALLLHGHTLFVVPDEVRYDGASMLTFLQQWGIDVLDCTPPQLDLLVKAGILEVPDAPSLLLIGGDAISEELWHALAHTPHLICYNVYGPTETTDISLYSRIEKRHPQPVIGHPLPREQVYLLDTMLEPVPEKVIGEIYIGGAGLAWGYLNQPDLTAERFLPNPLSKEPGTRLYKTGDLARCLPDGSLQFLGRADYQVKLRGYRIELGEIEAALRKHPAILEAVVVVQDTQTSASQLIAYITTATDLPLSQRSLRRFLRDYVPIYMLPTLFIRLEALPLTHNGKIDRRALPSPEQARPLVLH